MHAFSWFVLVPMVYAAVLVFWAGMAWRVGRILSRPAFKPPLTLYPVKRPAWLYALGDTLFMPRVLRHNLPLWIALMAFHLGLVVAVIGHLELVADIPLLQVIPHAIFPGKGLVGLVLLLSLAYFLVRRAFSPTKEISTPEDSLVLVLLMAVVLFGSQMDWARTWYDYSSMGVPDYRRYLWSLLTLKPDASGVLSAGHAFMLVGHVLFANLLLMVFPFTHLPHAMFSFALNRVRRG